MQRDLFDSVAEQLEQRTNLDRLEARGTLRIALKQAGVNPQTVSLHEISVVLENLLPGELESRGIENAAEICNVTLRNLELAPSPGDGSPSSIDDIFGRLGSA